MSSGLLFTGTGGSRAEEPPPDWEPIIEKIAKRVVDLGMETPAILFLEMHRPLTFFANQLLIFAAPMLFPFFGANADLAAKFFEDRANVDRLMRRIEAKSEEKRTEARLLRTDRRR